VTAHLYPVFF